jgi:cytochrome b pre-mRNA-processing protein 3
MVFGLFKRRSDDRALALYGEVIAAARRPSFYEGLRVPDTVEGRLELLMLHGGLVVARLSADDGDRDLARTLTEVFFADMDRTLREMGIGDLSVPKKMKSVAGAFYGRLQAYGEAPGEEALAEALSRNVYAGAEVGGSAVALARYVRAAAARLAETNPATLAAGRLDLPDPASFLPEESDR